MGLFLANKNIAVTKQADFDVNKAYIINVCEV